MSKIFCLLSLLALCGYAHFEKSADITSASIRLALAVAFSASLMVVAKKQLDDMLE